MRERNLIKYITTAINENYLYTEEEIIYLKRELNKLKGQLAMNKKLTSKGFGN